MFYISIYDNFHKAKTTECDDLSWADYVHAANLIKNTSLTKYYTQYIVLLITKY